METCDVIFDLETTLVVFVMTHTAAKKLHWHRIRSMLPQEQFRPHIAAGELNCSDRKHPSSVKDGISAVTENTPAVSQTECGRRTTFTCRVPSSWQGSVPAFQRRLPCTRQGSAPANTLPYDNSMRPSD